MYRASVCLVLVVALFGFSACSNDDNPTAPTEEEAPALPSISTMTMDLSFFEQAQIDHPSIDTEDPRPMELVAETGKENFNNAALRAIFVHLVFCAALQPPVSAFALAIHSVPQKMEDGSWLWTYIFVEGEVDYGIFLYGMDIGDRVLWRMEVSTNDPGMPLDHFVWFEGEAMKNDTAGYWQFYVPVLDVPMVAEPIAVAMTPGVRSIRIDWLNSPGDVHQLTILNNMPDSVDEGDNVVFSASPAMSYIEFTDVSVPEFGNITWYADGSGSLQVPDYNNFEKACWDSNQFDIVCPE